jgi:group I intron endonuclease
MKISGIYKIQSIIKPERIYIGSAENINDRWACHLTGLKKHNHHSRKLQRHYDKYGLGDLQFSVLLGCDKDDLLKTEQYFIDSYNPYFNICKIAGSNIGVKRSEETKNKLRIAFAGKKRKPFTDEHRKNLSIAAKRHKHRSGWKHTEESKKIMSELKMGSKIIYEADGTRKYNMKLKTA